MINFYIVLFKNDEWLMDVYCSHFPNEREILEAVYKNEADYALVEKRYEKYPFA